jgi:hypothetical protein
LTTKNTKNTKIAKAEWSHRRLARQHQAELSQLAQHLLGPFLFRGIA